MTSPLDRFRTYVDRPDARLDVGTGALLFALHEYPRLDVERYLGRIDAIGHAARRRVAGRHDPYQILRGLNEVVFLDEGFAPNTEDYYDPRNSFLNEVLDRRLGIPITISVLYLEAAARARLPVAGVAFPGHFVVRFDPPCGETLFVDPYNAGRVLTRDDLQAMLVRYAGKGTALTDDLLAPAGPREILHRMLRNLKRIYADAQEAPKLLWVTGCLLALDPESAEDARDHGMAAMQEGRYPQALAAMLRYAALDPDAADSPKVLDTIRDLRRLTVRLN